MTKPDGGPAFPCEQHIGTKFQPGKEPELMWKPVNGMSLRDYFAGLAMSRFIGLNPPEEVAASAYEIADAMLAEREK